MIFTNYRVSLNIDFILFKPYNNIVISLPTELISTALIFTLFLAQYEYRQALKAHMINLESTVEQRTRELKNTQQQLMQSEKMASLGTLLSGVAHEINNPLNFINGGFTLISDIKKQVEKNESLTKDFSTATSMINEGVNRISNIVNTLMSFSEITESKKKLSDIHQVIENTLFL